MVNPSPTPQSAACLRVTDLSCERDERDLFEGLEFTLYSGEALRIAGPNGSGKTTLMRGLVGLNMYLQGNLEWHRPGATPYLFMGHKPGISAQLTVWENLGFLARLRGLSPDANALAQALDAVALGPFDDSLGHQLSAGQQRRVMLALLYLPGLPPCWVLDEPFTALDRQGAAALELHLSAHCAAGGSVIFSTHHEPQELVFRTLMLGAVPT